MRIPLPVPNEPRDSTRAKDSAGVNCFLDREEDDGDWEVVKRPGTIFSSATAYPGQGLFNYEKQAVIISNDTLKVGPSNFPLGDDTWFVETAYPFGATVRRGGGAYYSIEEPNIGNDPINSPTYWSLTPAAHQYIVAIDPTQVWDLQASPYNQIGPQQGFRETTDHKYLVRYFSFTTADIARVVSSVSLAAAKASFLANLSGNDTIGYTLQDITTPLDIYGTEHTNKTTYTGTWSFVNYSGSDYAANSNIHVVETGPGAVNGDYGRDPSFKNGFYFKVTFTSI